MAGSTFAWDKRHSSPPSFIVPKTLYRLPSKLQSPPPTWWQNPHMKLWRIETVGKIEINTLQSFGLFLHQKVLLCGKLGDNSWLSVSPVFQPGQTFATTPFCGKLSGQHSTSGSQHVSIEKWILSQNICYRRNFVSNCVFCKKINNSRCSSE